jgi:small subunit ribosomal protein S11
MAEATTEAPVKEVKAKKTKAKKRSVPAGQVHIQATFNNTIISVTDNKGNVIAHSSAGACGFRGYKKGTAYAAQIASEKALSTAKQNHGLKKVDIFVKGTGMGREAAMRALHNVDVMVDSITDVTAVAHGGCRPRKARRG